MTVWAYKDLPKRRGPWAANTYQNRINCISWLSESLRLQRPDQGVHPAGLGRTDIRNFLNQLAFLQAEEKISAYQRSTAYARSARFSTRCGRWALAFRALVSRHGASPGLGAPSDVDEPQKLNGRWRSATRNSMPHAQPTASSSRT